LIQNVNFNPIKILIFDNLWKILQKI
jgi:hypothetical protein